MQIQDEVNEQSGEPAPAAPPAAVRVYTTGYAGKRPADLRRLAEALDAIVVDIRINPISRMPGWGGKQLASHLGDRYRQVPALGNELYRAGGFRIADLERGMAEVLALGRNVILLCVCIEYQLCHRRLVADAFAARGMRVIEIADWQKTIEM